MTFREVGLSGDINNRRHERAMKMSKGLRMWSLDELGMLKFSSTSKLWENFARVIEGNTGHEKAIRAVEGIRGLKGA